MLAMLLRYAKLVVMLGHDAVMSMAALAFALLLRFSGNIPDWMLPQLWLVVPYAVLTIVLLGLFGLYKGIWRYTSTNELQRIIAAISLTTLLTLAGLAMATRLEGFPRSVFIIAWFVQMGLIAGPRILYRIVRERLLTKKATPQTPQNVLLIGATDSAEMFIRETIRNPMLPVNVVGILDDNPAHQGRRIHTAPVLGTLRQLPQVLEKLQPRHKVDMLVLTSAEYVTNSALMTAARQAGLGMQRLPDLDALASGERVTNLRPVHIEDLLGRPPVKLDNDVVAGLVAGKTILVTGAGGSIGSELCRQAAANGAKTLLMLENSEYALYQIDQEMAQAFPELKCYSLLADVRNATHINQVLEMFQPNIILHAAAFKHVPLVEANPISGLENNLFGTQTVADAASQHGVETMVVISTDKAVNPTNVMGATKRAAEIYCQNHPGTTRYITVRFGNVLGSTGSVVPLFQKQIEQGGPVTITDKRMTRFFMTIPEAVQLTLQAAAMGNGGEIFVLDMGAPVSIYKMAEDLIRLSGLVPHEDIEIKEVGMRPGEKLFEELLHDREQNQPTPHQSVLLAKARKMPKSKLNQHLNTIRNACVAGNGFAAVTALQTLVPEYAPAQNSPFAGRAKKASSRT